MKANLKHTILAVSIGCVCSPMVANATNGYFTEGTGAKSRGMGGAGTAIAQETGSVVLNPANAVNMDARIDVAAGLFSPSPRKYTIADNDVGLSGTPPGAGTSAGQESRKTGFLIPYFGITGEIDNSSSWGLTVTALGGMNTDYKNNPFEAFNPAPATPLGSYGIDLKQVMVGATYAREINDKLSMGLTLSYVLQTFEAKGLGVFGAFGLSTDPTNLSNRGASISNGIGLTLGATFEVNKDVTLGFAYSPTVDMSEFDEYAGLFAEGGDFDIPSHLNLGVAWQISPKMLFAFDYKMINYTDVASVSNDSQRLTDGSCNPLGAGPNEPQCLGGALGAGFGWGDMDVFKFGIAYDLSADMVVRAGWNHGASPIEAPDAVINILAPGVVEDHITLGMTKKLSASTELTIDFSHALNNSVTGSIPGAFSSGNPAFGGNPTPSPGTTTIEMAQNWLEVQFSKKF